MEEGGPAPLAGGFQLFPVGPLWARSMTTLTTGLDHTADVCPRRTHTHAQPACSPDSKTGSCPGSTAQAGGEKPGQEDCGFPAWSVPTSPPLPSAPTLAQPLTCSFILAHAICLLARPWFVFGRRESLV